jgi:hypothetical protein
MPGPRNPAAITLPFDEEEGFASVGPATPPLLETIRLQPIKRVAGGRFGPLPQPISTSDLSRTVAWLFESTNFYRQSLGLGPIRTRCGVELSRLRCSHICDAGFAVEHV